MHGLKIDGAEMEFRAGETPVLDFGSTPSAQAEELLIIAAATQPKPRRSQRGEITGRTIDVALALVMFAFLLPLLLLVAAAIPILDSGPIIFSHRRIGRDGRQFKCYKFRTMRVGAEAEIASLLAQSPALRAEWEQGQKLAQDPRVSGLGRLLRASCMDELPQLFNVLVGEMSFVGPRPITANELPRYGRYVSSYLHVRPGLTGLWQVSRSRSTTYRRRVATDVLYVRRKSLALDCKILLATIPAVLMGKASY